jgi:CBS domain-containing protein
MAWLLGLYGFLGGGFFLIIIAFFIYIGASQEEAQVKTRSLLRGLTVADAYSRQARSLPADSTLADAIQLTLTSLQASFPICEEERLVGMLTYPKLVEALNGNNAATPVSEVMIRDVEAVAPDDDLFEVQLKLQGSQLDTLPVMANGRFLGIITNRDINEVYRLLSIDPDILDMRRRSWESDSRARRFLKQRFAFAKGKTSQPGPVGRIVVKGAGGNSRHAGFFGQGVAKIDIVGKVQFANIDHNK